MSDSTPRDIRVKYATAVLFVASAALLLACEKSADVPPPAPQPPVVEAPPVEAAPEAITPAVEATPAEGAPQTQAAASPAPSAAVSKPAPAKPATAPVHTAPGAAAETASATAEPDLERGQRIYRQACAFCHDKGVAGAPKTGDIAGWSPRLAQGMEALYASALRGKGAMPARGGNPALTDADVKAAVNFLVAQSR